MAYPLTPLLASFEGIAINNATILSWTATQACQITRYRATARTAPTGSNLTIAIQQNATTIATITIVGGSTDSGYTTAALNINSGDVLSLVITAVGSTYAGSSLESIVDLNATTLALATPTNTPYVITQEGTITVADIFTYTMIRTVQLTSGEFTLRTAPTGTSATATVYKNGVSQFTMTIAAGATDSGLLPQSINYQPGDILKLSITQVGSVVAGSGLQCTFNYTIQDLIGELTGVFYAEPDSEIISFLKQVGVGNGRADALVASDLVKYKRRANEIIDSALAGMYRTPLKTITRNMVTYYPEPVTQIAQRLVGYLLVSDVFSEVEPAASSNAERNYKMALEQLEAVASRKTVLKGQRYRSRSGSSNPYTEPLAPYTPPPPTP